MDEANCVWRRRQQSGRSVVRGHARTAPGLPKQTRWSVLSSSDWPANLLILNSTARQREGKCQVRGGDATLRVRSISGRLRSPTARYVSPRACPEACARRLVGAMHTVLNLSQRRPFTLQGGKRQRRCERSNRTSDRDA